MLKDYQLRHGIGMIGIPNYREVPVSFETGEIGSVDLFFNQEVKITKVRSIVTKALAATNAGTVTPKNNAGTTMTGGVLTHAASAILGDAQVGPITANNVIKSGEKMTLTTAKATAGGKLLVSVEYQGTRPAGL